MPSAGVGGFLAQIPPPLAIGSMEIEDGAWVKGFLCERHATEGVRDIGGFGGWRAYRAAA